MAKWRQRRGTPRRATSASPTRSSRSALPINWTEPGTVAVNVAARIVAHASAGEVLVSSTVRELVLGSGIEFVERGAYTLKAVPDEWHLYAVMGDGRSDARSVSEVSREVAALTPGPRETMRARDRALLAASQRSPGLMRALGRPILHRQRPRTRPKLT